MSKNVNKDSPILIEHNLFLFYANIFASQFQPLFELPRDTLYVECFWSLSIHSRVVVYVKDNAQPRFRLKNNDLERSDIPLPIVYITSNLKIIHIYTLIPGDQMNT